jgi:uncharacterized protein YndB with AHSA1/START domain
MENNSVSLHRVIATKPEKVFKAFTDPVAIASWYPPYGFLCTVQQFEPHTGGHYKMSFTNFSTGHKHSFGGKFHEIKQNEFIKYSDSFDDPKLPGEITTTIWIEKVSVGTDLTITQENIPKQIPAESCYLGWQDCLDKLIRLVTPEIKDEM